MNNDEKYDLKASVREYLERGLSTDEIVSRMMRDGYKKATIKKYVKIFSSLSSETK